MLRDIVLHITSENSIIQKTNIYALANDFICITESASSVSRGRKLIMTIELQYYMKLRANIKLNKFENLSI